MNPSQLVEIAYDISLTLLILGLILTFVRLVRGPSLSDRVVALDLTSALSVGLIGVVSIHTGQTVFLDVGMTLALVSFLATMAFARYIALDKHKLEEQENESKGHSK